MLRCVQARQPWIEPAVEHCVGADERRWRDWTPLAAERRVFGGLGRDGGGGNAGAVFRAEGSLTLGGAVAVCAPCIGVAIAADGAWYPRGSGDIGAVASFVGVRSVQPMTRREPILLLDAKGLISRRLPSFHGLR